MGLIRKYSQTLTNQGLKQNNLCRPSNTCEDRPQHMEFNTKVIAFSPRYLSFLKTQGLGGSANADFSKDFKGAPFIIFTYSFSMLIGLPDAYTAILLQNKAERHKILLWKSLPGAMCMKWADASFSDWTLRLLVTPPPSAGPLGRFPAMLWYRKALWIQNTCHGCGKALNFPSWTGCQ